jgi:hypothetical protein
MPISKSAEHRKYAQCASDCLDRMIEPTGETARNCEREMALEWIRRADAILHLLKS